MIDKLYLSSCDVGQGQVGQAQLDESIKGERQCDLPGKGELEDVARGDINGCELDPIEVRKAKKAEMEYFTKMSVYK